MYNHKLNISDTDKHVSELSLKMVPLDDYQVFATTREQYLNSDERTKNLLENINTDHLNKEEAFSLMEILNKFNHIFYLTGDKLTYSTTVMHRIPLTEDARVIHIKPYRLPLSQREEIKKQIDHMLKEKIIRHSKSAFSSPLLVVPKKIKYGRKEISRRRRLSRIKFNFFG